MSDTIRKQIQEASAISLSMALMKGHIEDTRCTCLHGEDFTLLIGSGDVLEMIETECMQEALFQYRYAQSSKVPLLLNSEEPARLEPGSIIREGAVLKKGCIVLMGAVVNIGAVIGEETMIDMNAVIGSGAKIGRRTHIGAGAVIAGMLEPICKDAVKIGDDVLIGANAVVLEGIQIGNQAVVGAGSVVTRDVPEGMVVQGIPARVVKARCEIRTDPAINESLR